jgi:hypothetical protein
MKKIVTTILVIVSTSSIKLKNMSSFHQNENRIYLNDLIYSHYPSQTYCFKLSSITRFHEDLIEEALHKVDNGKWKVERLEDQGS